MNICRQIDVDLIFQDSRGQRIRDLCSCSVDLSGPVHEESGMIINLVDIDQGLRLFQEKFSSRVVVNLYDFLNEVRNFLEHFFSPFVVKISAIQLKTSWGQIHWAYPGKQEDFRLIQHHRLLLSSSSKHFEVYKLMTEQRGSSIDLFERLEKKILRKLWEAQQQSLSELIREMKKVHHLSGFGVQDFSGQYQQWFRLSFQELSAKTFRE